MASEASCGSAYNLHAPVWIVPYRFRQIFGVRKAFPMPTPDNQNLRR